MTSLLPTLLNMGLWPIRSFCLTWGFCPVWGFGKPVVSVQHGAFGQHGALANMGLLPNMGLWPTTRSFCPRCGLCLTWGFSPTWGFCPVWGSGQSRTSVQHEALGKQGLRPNMFQHMLCPGGASVQPRAFFSSQGFAQTGVYGCHGALSVRLQPNTTFFNKKHSFIALMILKPTKINKT